MVESWGRYPTIPASKVHCLTDRHSLLPPTKGKQLIYGNGRSYGDVCLHAEADILLARGLDHFISFDAQQGILRAEAGVLFSDILDLCVPLGWFVPVTPGTCCITLGGAVANDVHGKNHHQEGTFGCHIRAFELLRSTGERLLCSKTNNTDWYAATIGGLGLTGLITWVEIQLRSIAGPWIQAENKRFSNLTGFFRLLEYTEQKNEFMVAWFDCVATGSRLGRGILTQGNFAKTSIHRSEPPQTLCNIPWVSPICLINRVSLKIFNTVYARQPDKQYVLHYRSFFYPLDKIGHWNRLYGPKGFLQYQCVLPWNCAEDASRILLNRITQSGEGSCLAVLKKFGDRVSPGMLSFPRPGITLALDFPFRGKSTLKLLDDLDQIVLQAHGAIYPAKDARMSRALFEYSYPNLDQFSHYVDPALESSLWCRLTH